MVKGGLTTRGPRNLLRQIREAMAGGGPAQDRLDMVVRTIAQSMVAEVCSIYLRRASGELELFATQGLNPEAVHNTRLRPGEGLVGEVARLAQPISLSDAPSHPSFSYRPETGEDPFHAFLGAPLLRGGRAIGVLVVQNRAARRYRRGRGRGHPDHRHGPGRDGRLGRTAGPGRTARRPRGGPYIAPNGEGLKKFAKAWPTASWSSTSAVSRLNSCCPTTRPPRKNGWPRPCRRSRPASTSC